MTNMEKALALINTFVSGDLEKAKELLAPEYKQHNLSFGTGADAFIKAVAGLKQASVKTTVNNIRAFEDGDYVFLHTIYNFAGSGEQVTFDIFHFNDDGKIGIGDVLIMQRHIAAKNSEAVRLKHSTWILDETHILIGDVNDNKSIDMGDILKLQRYIAAENSETIKQSHPDWIKLR